ncbi:MAG: hypothetical protein KC496_08885 [Anaerolineae bacterium]|nr:hypothetical protein [Anaerolineae bacterium]
MMNEPTTYSHPLPWQQRFQQISAMLMLSLGLIGAVTLLLTAILLPAPLFALMAFMVILLLAPVLWMLVATPPVTVAEDGLHLHHFIGNTQHIPWDAIESVQHYPLLPTEQNEVLRRLLQGRKQYRQAEGIMLVIPTLPWPHRIGGFFAGQNSAPIVAFTNRTHRHYPELANAIAQAAPDVFMIAKEPTA